MPKNKRSRAFVYQYCLSFTHERAEDLKRSMIGNMPPKGMILSDFIRTFAILDSVSVGNLFFATLK
jgi:hypothetical protein